MKSTLIIIMLIVVTAMSGCSSSSVSMFNVPQIQDDHFESRYQKASEDPRYEPTNDQPHEETHAAESEHGRSRRRDWKEAVKKIYEVPVKIAAKFIDKIDMSKIKTKALKVKEFFKPSSRSDPDLSDETHL